MKRLALFALILALCGLIVFPYVARADDSYQSKLLTRFNSHIVAYWPLEETSGSTASDVSGHSRNGTAYGIVWADADGASSVMGKAPKFDAVNDYIDVYSTSLKTAFPSAAGTVSLWFKMRVASVWTDGAARSLIDLRDSAGGASLLNITKNSTTNHLFAWVRNAGAGGSVNPAYSGADWTNVILTWSTATGKSEFYINNGTANEATTTCGLANSLLYAAIGAVANPGAVTVTDGWIGHVIFLDYVASADDRAVLADSSPPPTPTPTPTPTLTPTPVPSPSPTPYPILMISTLPANGQEWALDHTISIGQIANVIPLLLLLVFMVVILLTKLARRR